MKENKIKIIKLNKTIKIKINQYTKIYKTNLLKIKDFIIKKRKKIN